MNNKYSFISSGVIYNVISYNSTKEKYKNILKAKTDTCKRCGTRSLIVMSTVRFKSLCPDCLNEMKQHNLNQMMEV